MDGSVWFISILVSALLAALFVLTFVPFFARWSAYRHSVLIRIDLPVRLERTVSARLMTSARGASVGGIVFVVVAAIALHVGLVVDNPRVSSWFIAGARVAGSGTGTAIAAFVGTSTIDSDRPRVARSGAVNVAQYLAPQERILALAVVALSVFVAIAGLALDADFSFFPAALFAVLAVVSLLMFEVVGRRIVDLSQPAGSTAELVWDDAIRASILRDMLTAPLALGAYSATIGLVGIANSAGDDDWIFAANLTGLTSAAVVLAIAIYTRVTSPQRYFIRRLWPDLRWSDTADETADAA